MSDLKVCPKCNKEKSTKTDFYFCKGKMRRECKKCTSRQNVNYQRRVKAWKYRFVDNDMRRSYMVEYYAKNKQRYAEYRRKFKEKYPEYYKEYSRKRKMKT